MQKLFTSRNYYLLLFIVFTCLAILEWGQFVVLPLIHVKAHVPLGMVHNVFVLFIFFCETVRAGKKVAIPMLLLSIILVLSLVAAFQHWGDYFGELFQCSAYAMVGVLAINAFRLKPGEGRGFKLVLLLYPLLQIMYITCKIFHWPAMMTIWLATLLIVTLLCFVTWRKFRLG